VKADTVGRRRVALRMAVMVFGVMGNYEVQ
jgi:hypothetical protein